MRLPVRTSWWMQSKCWCYENKNKSTVVADSETSVAKLYAYQNEGNFVPYISIIECFEM